MNNIDIVILFLLEVLSVVVSNPLPKQFTYTILISVLLLCIPHMVLIFYICCKLTKKGGITQCLKRIYKSLKICASCTGQTEADVEAEFDTDSLPDRLIRSCKQSIPPLDQGMHREQLEADEQPNI